MDIEKARGKKVGKKERNGDYLMSESSSSWKHKLELKAALIRRERKKEEDEEGGPTLATHPVCGHRFCRSSSRSNSSCIALLATRIRPARAFVAIIDLFNSCLPKWIASVITVLTHVSFCCRVFELLNE